jgi:hypothetical protein
VEHGGIVCSGKRLVRLVAQRPDCACKVKVLSCARHAILHVMEWRFLFISSFDFISHLPTLLSNYMDI